MVECEYDEKMKESYHQGSFNRYMVECEWLGLYEVEDDPMVLIDTWWNVNATLSMIIQSVFVF